MKMADAAYQALESLGRPATVHEIYQEIQRLRLFEFAAKDPKGILSKTLRKHTQGSKTLVGEPKFASPRAGTFVTLSLS